MLKDCLVYPIREIKSIASYTYHQPISGDVQREDIGALLDMATPHN